MKTTKHTLPQQSTSRVTQTRQATWLLRLLRLSFVCILLSLFGKPVNAETPFFWDDFARTSLYDTDIDYFVDETPEEELSIVDGSLSIIPLVDNSPGVSLIDPDFGRVRLETSFRFVDAPSGGNPFVFFSVGTFEVKTDWAGLASDGRMVPGTAVGQNIVWDQSRRLGSYADMISNDIHMVVEVDEEELSITSWLDGNEPDPEFKLTEDRVSDRVADLGIFLDPDSRLNESILLRHLAVLPFVDGDFNASDKLDVGDIDLISSFLQTPEAVRPKSRVRVYDLNRDNATDDADRQFLIADLFGTYFGDSNLDGEFNSSDFVQVFEAAEYEDSIAGNSTWATGDWNGDADFNSSDFVLAFQSGGYEKGPRAETVAVPEPSSILMLATGLAMMFYRRSTNSPKPFSVTVVP